MSWFEEKEKYVELSIRVIPRASKNAIQEIMGNCLKIRIQAPPVDGKANQHLIKFLSKEWKIPRSTISIISGDTGRNKRIRIDHPPESLISELRNIT